MGCGKSKHAVVTGNTTKVKKPSEPESVKGKDSETIQRQESCRCRKKNQISTVENDIKKPEENDYGGDCGEKTAVEMINGDEKPEEKETATTLLPVTEILPENIVTEETVNDVKESVDEQKEEINMGTVVEEDKTLEDKNDVDTKIQSPEVEEPKMDEQTLTTELEVQEIPTTENDEIAKESDETVAAENEEIVKQSDDVAATENEEITTIEEISKESDEVAVAENDNSVKESDESTAAENEEIIKENDEIATTENEEITAIEVIPKESDETAAAENEEIAATETDEITVSKDDVTVDAVEVVQESLVDVTKEVESA